MIPIVVLAAGASTRMGRPKQLVAWDDTTLVAHAVDTATRTGCGRVIVVVGANAALVRGAIDERAVRVVDNPAWARGIGGSLQAGVRAALDDEPGLDAVLVTLADLPMLTVASYAKLLDAFARDRPAIVAAAYDGTRGAPMILARDVLDDVLAMDPGAGAKQLIARAAQVVAVDLPEARFDIDTPEDLTDPLHRGKVPRGSS